MQKWIQMALNIQIRTHMVWPLIKRSCSHILYIFVTLWHPGIAITKHNAAKGISIATHLLQSKPPECVPTLHSPKLLILFFLFTTALLGSSKKGESPNQPPWERIHIQLWSGVSKNLEYIQWGQGKLSSYLIVWIERMQQNSFQGEQFSCTFTCVRNPDEASGDVYNPMNQTKVDLKC